MAKPNLHSLSKMDFTKVVPARQAKIEAAPASPVPSMQSYLPNQLAAALHPAVQHLKVSAVTERGPDVRSYTLVPDEAKGTKALAYFSAGQYLSLSLAIGQSHLTRPYSLSSSPRESLAGTYELTVKGAEGGLASHFILDTWAPGTEVTASAPLGEFTYEPLRDAKTIVGLAGGSGITPFRSLASAIADGDEDASLVLLYGSRTLRDALFLDEFRALEARCPRFRLVNVLSDEPQEGCEQGFLTAVLIRKYAPEGDYSLFLCGPQAMYRFVDAELGALSLRRKFIRHELFGEYRHPERDPAWPGTAGGPWTLTVTVCGETRQMPCSADETLLVSMEKNGLSVPSRCRSGQCGWCHSRLISGEVYIPESVDGRRLADREFGYIHPCCTFPLGDVCLDVPPFRP